MNKRSYFLIPVTCLLLVTFLFSACKKSLDNDVQPQIPAAGLMAFNLTPDKTVSLTIGGNNLTNFPLLYTNYTGVYQGVYTGNRDVTSYDVSTGATLATANQVFNDSSYYSVFVVGANGKYRNLVVKDDLDSLSTTTGEAFIRYVNAIPDSTTQPTVTISSNGTNVFNNNASFPSVSDFKAITPGSISVKVNTESGINSNRDITVEKGKIYTILLVGIPQSIDSTRVLQIKFIQNGTVLTTP